MIVLALALAATPQLGPIARYDLSCAESTLLVSSVTPDLEKRGAFQSAYMFYLGRLSGRDESTNWVERVMSDGSANKLTPDQNVETAVSCMSRIMDLVKAGMAPPTP